MALRFNYNIGNATNLDQIPLADPPPGTISDFKNNPGNTTNSLIGVATPFFAATLVAVGIRLYTKLKILRSWTWDDVTLGIAALGTIGFYVLTILEALIGKVGSHAWNVPLGTVYSVGWVRMLHCFNSLVPVTMGALKLTFFIFLHSLFKRYRYLRWTTIAGMIVTPLFYLTMVITELVIWLPRPGVPLSLKTEEEHTLPENNTIFIASCGGVILDLIIWTLPILAIKRLQISGNQRYGIVAIFFIGLVAIAASCSAMAFRWRLNVMLEEDFLFYAQPTILSTGLELACGCIAASLPSAVLFYNHFRRRRLINHNNNNNINHHHKPERTGVETYIVDFDSGNSKLDATLVSKSMRGGDDHYTGGHGWSGRGRGRYQHRSRKGSMLSSGLGSVIDHMASPFAKLGADHAKTSQEVGWDTDGTVTQTHEMDVLDERPTSADALAIYGVAANELEPSPPPTASGDASRGDGSSEELREADTRNDNKRGEQLRGLSPSRTASRGPPTPRYAFGD